MMQDIILARVWADHHQRIYGEGDVPKATDSAQPARMRSDAPPIAGKAMVLALAASMASLGSGLAAVATA